MKTALLKIRVQREGMFFSQPGQSAQAKGLFPKTSCFSSLTLKTLVVVVNKTLCVVCRSAGTKVKQWR